MFETYLKQVVGGEALTSDQAYNAANMLLQDDISEVKAAAFLAALRTRRENEEELFGFVKALQEHAITIDTDLEVIDTCGTGGDGQGTFNISTAAALVVASCGVPVAKHGNRAVTSQVGSADVLESLGVKVDLKPDEAKRLLEKVGITFLFAPYYHPIMKQVGPLRRGMGVPTVFNFLGPLINPCRLTYQVMGVADGNIQETVARTMSKIGRKRAMVVHGHNGMDEISSAGLTRVYEVFGQDLVKYDMDPRQLGIVAPDRSNIQGADAATNARIIVRILDGELGSCRDVVVLNAAAALMTAGRVGTMQEGVMAAKEALSSGRTKATLKALVQYSRDGVMSC
ncbi:MAG: anthranilate phosphoribosyltransferase [Ignavibacteriales bacterium]